MTPATLAKAQETRRYFEEKIVQARAARDWHRVAALDQRLAHVNEEIRKHFVEEGQDAELRRAHVAESPKPASTDVPLF